MAFEDRRIERKSLRLVDGPQADWDAVARACVCLANAEGGRLVIGIEDGQLEPPESQEVPAGLVERVRRRVGELTVNVQAFPEVQRGEGGGAYIEVAIPRSTGVASTTDGRYFVRVGDACRPIVGDDVLRLADERPGFAWEEMATELGPSASDPSKVQRLVAGLRSSDRVKPSVTEKTDLELLAHYGLTTGSHLTRLGLILIGGAQDRRSLGVAPVVQAVKYDEHGRKVNKWSWDDGVLSPIELIDDVWRTVTDFRETYEVTEGLYRREVPAFDEGVVRELLVNALVHRPYTQQGDVFVNLHPDRLEVVNPGRLPLGVTPQNVLHASRRRNNALARVFHDLQLMEREGSGYDFMYDRLLSQGRPAPVLVEGPDWVKVTVERRILRPAVMRLVAEADARFQLTQRERITLGVLAQTEGLSARELAAALELPAADALTPWLARLPAFGLVQRAGRTRGTRYFVTPELLRASGAAGFTSLARIEPHRLRELVREDLRRYPDSRIGQIEERVGQEVSRSRLKRVLSDMVREGTVVMTGHRAAARYRLAAG